ncbi:MAG: GNAT family protein [Devosia sp.]
MPSISPSPAIALLPWDESGHALLRSMNTPEQKRYLGGPENAEKVDDRHARYLTYHLPGGSEMLRIAADGMVVGSIGYWETTHDGAQAYETGWEILAAAHGRGIGSQAAQMLVDRLRLVARHPVLYAYPSPDNAGSNGICRKLGFELLGVGDFEYPKGVVSTHNIWRLDLR